MKKSEVVIGSQYKAKVSGKLVSVLVTGEETVKQGRKKFEVTNLVTNRKLLMGAGKLRPMPPLLSFFIDANGSTKQIDRAEAVQTVNECIGVGQWLTALRQARTSEGLLIPGIGCFRARNTE